MIGSDECVYDQDFNFVGLRFANPTYILAFTTTSTGTTAWMREVEQCTEQLPRGLG